MDSVYDGYVGDHPLIYRHLQGWQTLGESIAKVLKNLTGKFYKC